MTTWAINAYCPKGHLNVIRLEVTETGMLLKVDEGCDTCRENDRKPRSRLSRAERRDIRRAARALKRWDGRL